MPRARKYEGVVYRRAGTEIWWIRYRDRKGIARRESSQTADWQQANKRLRERLQGGMRTSLKSHEGAKPWLSGNGRICSWRTIPNRPYALRKHTKRTSGASNTLRLHSVQPDWWMSPPIRSTSTFASAFDSASE